MKRPTDRRTVLIGAGAAALVVASGPVAAQPADVRGTVTFQGGAAIPKGDLLIYLEDPAIQDSTRRRVAETTVKSDGRSKTLDFLLPQLNGADASPALRIVARLERQDGWLIARGSAQITTNAAVDVTLTTVIY